MERGVAEVMRYVEDFDGLLCLVAESIRYLQEMEALSKGYARWVFPLLKSVAMAIKYLSFCMCCLVYYLIYQVFSDRRPFLPSGRGWCGRVSLCCAEEDIPPGGECPQCWDTHLCSVG